jgi:ABC-type transport system involved in cytochrome c biogenesis ATPase subunit
MLIQVRNRCSDFDSYRAARVKSLFNAESGCNFDLDAELAIEDSDWQIGVVVGPSGSGKTSIGRQIFGDERAFWTPAWPADQPIVDVIAPAGDFNEVTGALGSVGLGTVPAWLRPYSSLSNGERFRADLARLVCEAPEAAVVDEFTSVVDRQIAKLGALAFSKAWRRLKMPKVVVLTPHYTSSSGSGPTGSSTRRRRPSQGGAFDDLHSISKSGRQTAVIGRCLSRITNEAAPDGRRRVLHRHRRWRARVPPRRLVHEQRPKSGGAGVPAGRDARVAGRRCRLRFLNEICAMQEHGDENARLPGRRTTTIFHTSHPQLAAALRRDKRWRQVSAALFGGSKAKSSQSIRASKKSRGTGEDFGSSGYGGHFRAVQGFRYYGAKAAASAAP